MLLSALDPALLFYDPEDWEHREAHCFDRFRALSLHLQMTKDYRQKIAMCDELEGLMWQKFPWDAESKNIPEVRDLRQFMYDDLLRVRHQVDIEEVGDIDLEPEGILCECIRCQEIVELWERLLCGCVSEITEFDPQIASWATATNSFCSSIRLTICSTGTQHELPLVWDDYSWATQLAGQDWWPDLQRCVELKFRTRYITHSMAREQPVPFECSSRFLSSLDQIRGDRQLQDDIVEALTKTVYGIHDIGLGYEIIRGTVRFRVTESRRVHGRMANGKLILEEFGGHRMGDIG